MTNVLTLRDLIKYTEAYLSRGDGSFLSGMNPGFSDLVKISVRSGIDVVELLRESLPMLEALERAVRHSRERWLGVALRVTGVLGLVVVARLCLLRELSDSVFQSWILLDRMCGGCAILAALSSGLWVRRFYALSTWTTDRDRRLVLWFRDYLTLCGSDGHLAELRVPLRAVRLAELTDGVDGQDVRKRLYLRDLTHEVDAFKRLSPRIAFLSILIEWGVFFCAALGFGLIPFLAWIETSAGV